MVLGSDDTVAGGAFPQHIQVHELTSVVLRVERASQAPHRPLCLDTGRATAGEWEFLKSVAGLSCYLVQIW